MSVSVIISVNLTDFLDQAGCSKVKMAILLQFSGLGHIISLMNVELHMMVA